MKEPLPQHIYYYILYIATLTLVASESHGISCQKPIVRVRLQPPCIRRTVVILLRRGAESEGNSRAEEGRNEATEETPLEFRIRIVPARASYLRQMEGFTEAQRLSLVFTSRCVRIAGVRGEPGNHHA